MDADWEDLRTVLAVVRGGTLATAATILGVNYTTVARRVQRVEAALGETLFDRLADGYRPTEAGRMVADHAAGMETRQQDLFRRLQGRDQSLGGRLVITAPQLLVGPHLAPVMARFTDLHPLVDLHLRATNDLLDLTRREADLAIRISRSPGDSLTGIRLCAQQAASFAAPQVAEAIAVDPNAPVDWIAYEQTPRVPEAVLGSFPNTRLRYVFDDMVAMVGAAQAGLGAVRMPMFLGRATPGLVQVPLLPPQPYADIWVVGHRDVWRAAKPRAFREVLIPWFRSRRADFVA